MTKVKIKSEGTFYNTHIFIDDHEICNCTALSYKINPKTLMSEVILKLDNAALDLVSDNMVETKKIGDMVFLTQKQK